MRDLLHAVRRLSRSPGTSLTLIGILALSIGSTIAIFSLVWAVLFAPLPFPEPDRLVEVYNLHEGERWSVSPLDLQDLRRDNRVFRDMGAHVAVPATLAGEEGAERLSATLVTTGFFTVLGVEPAHGRSFRETEEVAAASRVVILSDALWHRRFGADAEIVGRSITLAGERHQVVGVMPPGFDYPTGSELWAPIGWEEGDLDPSQRGAHYLQVIARLRPGVSVEEAASEVAALDSALLAEHPRIKTGWSTGVVALREWITGDVRPALLVLLGGVALLLAITAVNVAHMLVLQALARRRDHAIQRAVGASGYHLLRQRLIHGLLLAGVGAGAGLLTAFWLVELFKLLPADQIPRLGSIAVGPPALLLAAGITLLCTLLIVLAGGGERRGELVERLRANDVAGGRGTQRRRALLVVLETALAVALLVGTGLLARSMLHLQAVDPGFDPSRLATFDLAISASRYPEPAQAARFVADYHEQLAALPGVTGVGAMSRLPLAGGRYQISVSEVDGVGPATPAEEQMVEVRVMTPGTLALLGVPLASGRRLDATDGPSAPTVTLVNEAAARLLWPTRDPLGHRVELGTSFGLGGPRAGGEVVGVVADVRDDTIDAPPRPTVYLSHAQFPLSSMSVVVATAGDPLAAIGPARQRLQQLDPELALANPRTVASLVDDQLLEPRLYAFLIGLFAAAALGLTALGLYGSIAFAVERRTREIGLRMALGADRASVLRMVLGGAGGLALAGIAGGLGLALLLGRSLAGLLYEIRPADPATLAGVGLLTALIALAASLLPARRATRLDPTTALRSE